MDKILSRQKRKAQLAYATYRVLQAISKRKTQKQIANEILKINKSNASRRIHVLAKAQLIEKDFRTSYNQWRITRSGKAMMQHLRNIFGTATLTDENFPITFRWHHIMFKLTILKTPVDMQHLLQQNKYYYGKKEGFLYGWIKRVQGADILVTGKSILIYPKPIEAGSVNDAVIAGCNLVDYITTMLHDQFPLLEFQDRTQICRQHCAMVGGITNFFPREFHYESDRLVIDCSTGVPELECIHKTYSITDMQNLAQFFEGVIRVDER